MESKHYIKSKTIIGALVAAAMVFGVPLPFDEGELQDAVRMILEVLGFVMIVYGRIKANKSLTT